MKFPVIKIFLFTYRMPAKSRQYLKKEMRLSKLRRQIKNNINIILFFTTAEYSMFLLPYKQYQFTLCNCYYGNSCSSGHTNCPYIRSSSNRYGHCILVPAAANMTSAVRLGAAPLDINNLAYPKLSDPFISDRGSPPQRTTRNLPFAYYVISFLPEYNAVHNLIHLNARILGSKLETYCQLLP
jgi:hypothetical protein